MFPAPRAAYIHVPFCRHRCGYCNFTVIANRDDLQVDYLRALELEMAQLEHAPPPVDTLFIGGGTPTALRVDHLRRLCEMTRQRFLLSDNYEWTIELIRRPKLYQHIGRRQAQSYSVSAGALLV